MNSIIILLTTTDENSIFSSNCTYLGRYVLHVVDQGGYGQYLYDVHGEQLLRKLCRHQRPQRECHYSCQRYVLQAHFLATQASEKKGLKNR